jgi:hypothetical protein
VFNPLGIGETEIFRKHTGGGSGWRLPQNQGAQAQDCFPHFLIQLEGALEGNRQPDLRTPLVLGYELCQFLAEKFSPATTFCVIATSSSNIKPKGWGLRPRVLTHS